MNTDAPTQKKMTDAGTVMGTVGYMAPEQVRGQEADHRADIFAFGVILYEMLGGRRTFGGESAIEVMNAILKEEPPELSETNAKISPALDRIVRRCLEKRPERRFQSASDLGFALEALSAPSDAASEAQLGRQAALPAMTERASWARLFGNARLAWLVAAALLLMTLGVSWAYFKRTPTPDARVMKLSLLPPEKTSFGYVAVSPDGRWLAFTAATGSKVQLWVRALADIEAKPLEGTEGAIYPFWSPDSRFIGFFAGGKLKKVEVSGGPPLTLCDAGVSTGGTWNREGVILFSSLGAGGIASVPAGGGAPTILLRAEQKLEGGNLHAPSFLPDGRHFLYFLNSVTKEKRGVYVGSRDGSLRRRLLGGDSNAIYAPSHAANTLGVLLFRRENALMAQPFDTAALQLVGEPFSVAARVGAFVIPYNHQNVSVSDNGVLVFDPLPNRRRTQVRWVDRAGKIINSFDDLDNLMHVRLAPDDKRFALVRVNPQDSSTDVWLLGETGGTAMRFTFEPGHDLSPVWSPDGSRIVWASNRTGVFNLYEKDAGGTGQDALLLESALPNLPTDWSRDGRYVIYRQIDPQAKYDIWAIDLGERKPFPLLQTEANEAAAVLSPDGRWMAYSSDESGRYEIYVQSFPGGGSKRQISTGGGIGPHWRGDGRELYYHAPDGKLMAAPVTIGTSLEVGTPVALFEFRPATNAITPYYSVTRDGQRFLLSTIVETEPNAPLTVVVNWSAELKK